MEHLYFKVYFLISTVISAFLACDVPPSQWCSSKEISSRCQVTEQCESYLNSIHLSESGKPDDKNTDLHFYEHDVVKIGFYYESMCPDCKDFMKLHLYPAFKSIPQLFTTDFVPYGNANEYWDNERWQFRCQHGSEECYGNIIQTCALDLYSYNMTFSFIACMEESCDFVNQSGKYCAEKFGLEWDKLEVCSTSTKGNTKQHNMAVKTEALVPKHTFVPWITLNGEHTDAIQKAAEIDLIQLICDNFKGNKPPVCKIPKRRLCVKDP